MSSVRQVREALAAQIQSVSGITCVPRMPDQVNPPLAVIGPGSPYAKYGVTMSVPMLGLSPGNRVPAPTELNLVVDVFVARSGSIEDAQALVDQYLGFEPDDTITSIPLAIDSDPTLGGVVEWCVLGQVTAYGDIEYAGQTYFRGRITVAISVAQDYGD